MTDQTVPVPDVEVLVPARYLAARDEYNVPLPRYPNHAVSAARRVSKMLLRAGPSVVVRLEPGNATHYQFLITDLHATPMIDPRVLTQPGTTDAGGRWAIAPVGNVWGSGWLPVLLPDPVGGLHLGYLSEKTRLGIADAVHLAVFLDALAEARP